MNIYTSIIDFSYEKPFSVFLDYWYCDYTYFFKKYTTPILSSLKKIAGCDFDTILVNGAADEIRTRDIPSHSRAL